MAVEGPDFFMRRKRKREQCVEKKLVVNDRVEVKSMEEGFLGSWHPGIVTACGPGTRHVRYDNLLDDKASDNLIEIVSVSAILDGSTWLKGRWPKKCETIRPVPPSLTFVKTDLPYGLCVDAYYEEAWWEGVIFDHQNCEHQRIIFFPELGDEVKTEISQLRITQDWDEATETWQPRGNWMFLEMIKEFEQESFIAVSVKQIWYDLRARDAFIEVGDWTCNSKELWEPLVFEVIDEYTELTLNEVFSILDFSNDFFKDTPELRENEINDFDMLCKVTRSTDEVDIVLETSPRNSESEFHLDTTTNHHAFTSPEVRFAENLHQNVDTAIAPVNNDRNASAIPPVEENCRDHLHSGISSTFNDTISVASVPYSAMLAQKESGEPTQDVPFFSQGEIPCIAPVVTERKLDRYGNNGRPDSITCTTKHWKPKSLPEGVSCLPAVQIYERTSSINCRNNYKPEVLKHLSYRGWKRESYQNNQYHRVRYLSPDGKYYHSLQRACSAIIKHERRMNSEISLEDGGSLNSATDATFSDIMTLKQEYNQESECSPKTVQPCSPGSVLDPKLCPEALVEYILHARNKASKNTKNMRLKAQKHLLAVGWEFCFYTSRRTRQIRYISPRGHTYPSLLKACEAVMSTSEHSCTSKENGNRMKIGKISSARSDKSARMCSSFSQPVTLSDPNEGGIIEKSLSYPTTHQLKKKNARNVKESRLSQKWYKERECNEGRREKRILRSRKTVQKVFVPCSAHIKPQNMFSWLVDNNVVVRGDKVSYRVNKTSRSKLAEGIIMYKGIKCNCCQVVFSLTGFANHATVSSHSRSAAHIFLEDGRSLLECQMQMRNDSSLIASIKDDQQVSENDHICSVCHYGGELILCDHCPSSFHKSCVYLKDIPEGDWFCPSCCCKICAKYNFEDDKNNHFLSCSQCERKYHVSCLKNIGVNNIREQTWFCCNDCEKIYVGLHRILGKPISVGVNGLTWTLVKHLNSDSCGLHCHGPDYLAESYCKLNVALAVMHECFEPVKDSYTGRDLMEDVIFSTRSVLPRLNFEGFYTILLETNEELVSVATIRVYGEKVAEMPLVGTRVQYRRLGMCRMLMNQLEKKLMELGVERLVLPAVPSVSNTWTSSFGFSNMANSERSQFLDYTFLDFQDTVMCHKLLKDPPVKSIIFEETLPKSHDACGSDSDEREGLSPSSEVSEAEDIEKSETDKSQDKDVSTRSFDMAMVNQQNQNEFRDYLDNSSPQQRKYVKYYARRKCK